MDVLTDKALRPIFDEPMQDEGFDMADEVAMTPERFREALDLLPSSQNGFARFLKIDPRTVRRYSSGELPVPTNIAILMELMIRFDVTPERALKLAGLKPLDPE
ncbi:hypothetical protein ACVMGC_004795 [Bradyrhizobium barranii subsp. barranii]|uniref:hypothetical protein n=1 Tax=Bradyrhizobium liaoningense TaxID=43992 RepID=UPI001BADB7A9|nr:hypothetical protein [Bradyrhizobium liaoningense]MBR0879130.1 hypothetical protein [Bradyrhizobium liaoningense]